MEDDLELFKIKLGRRIAQLREKKGFRQAELAAMINKDYQSLSRIETGRTSTSGYVLMQIAQALDVDMNELFNIGAE